MEDTDDKVNVESCADTCSEEQEVVAFTPDEYRQMIEQKINYKRCRIAARFDKVFKDTMGVVEKWLQKSSSDLLIIYFEEKQYRPDPSLRTRRQTDFVAEANKAGHVVSFHKIETTNALNHEILRKISDYVNKCLNMPVSVECSVDPAIFPQFQKTGIIFSFW
jgi:hypothetical protein